MKNNKLKILIIGSGGREHAIGWKVAQSPRAGELFFAPGNGGTASLGKNIDIKATDIEALLTFAKKENIDMTLALPDDPLALGIVDLFTANGLKIFGPTKIAAQLESSKAFSKHFMESNNLPTASFKTFTNFDEAVKYLDTQNLPIVVKASGLALGKGVIIAQNKNEAIEALDNILVKKIFGDAGNEVVIEEFMTGMEISTHAFSDGKSYSIFPTSQDHKRVGEGDTGLNTGGMGTIAPVPIIKKEMLNIIEQKIIAPTLSSMDLSGMPFSGVLYPGLMITKDGPKILEYNARFGDPETQSYMRLLETDIIDIFEACINGTLNEVNVKWKSNFACTIVLASGGYPGNYEKGKIIFGLNSPLEEYPKGEVENLNASTPTLRVTPQEGNNIVIFHAGTKIDDKGNLVTNGGRVIGVSAIGNTLEEALKNAYEAVSKISFDGMQYRRDIGQKVLKYLEE